MNLNSRPVAGAAPSELPEGTVHPVPRPEGLGEGIVEDREPVLSGVVGRTVVSLGAVTEPGLWLKTPLVVKTRPGQVTWQGKSVAVTLIPIVGQSSAGSRMSLAAMQTLGIPLTDLSEVQVSAD